MTSQLLDGPHAESVGTDLLTDARTPGLLENVRRLALPRRGDGLLGSLERAERVLVHFIDDLGVRPSGRLETSPRYSVGSFAIGVEVNSPWPIGAQVARCTGTTSDERLYQHLYIGVLGRHESSFSPPAAVRNRPRYSGWLRRAVYPATTA